MRGHPDMVWPQLGFHEDDEVWTDQVVSTADGPGKILRKVEQLDFLRQAFASERVAGRSRRGHDNAQVGELALQRADEQERDIDLAHAHRLNPAAGFLFGGELLAQVRRVKTE